MKHPRWIDPRALLLLHQESLAGHGGLPELRDENALESALARPLNVNAYEPQADVARLATAYGFGIVRKHPFNDGNKRTGFLAIGLFLELNRFSLISDTVDAIETITRLAGGRLSEAALAKWIRERISRH